MLVKCLQPWFFLRGTFAVILWLSLIFDAAGNLVEPILTIKQIVYYAKNTTILYNYWYFVTATCFGLSVDHIQANFRK